MHSLWNHQQLQECPDYGRESYIGNLLLSCTKPQNNWCWNLVSEESDDASEVFVGCAFAGHGS